MLIVGYRINSCHVVNYCPLWYKARRAKRKFSRWS